jgi:dipeptidyl aminopeptidase/acylaminoacyl peptidase
MSELDAETVFGFRFLSEPRLSPDGEVAAFLVNQVKEEGDGYSSNIWLHDFKDGETNQLTTAGESHGFAWGSNQEIVFTSDRDREEENEEERTDFFRVDITGGEARKAFSVERAVSSFSLTGDSIVYRSAVDVDDDGSNELEGDCTTLTEIPFWENGQGFTSEKRNHLFAKKLKKGSEDKELTPGKIDVSEFSVRKNKVAFVGTKYEGKAPITNELYMVSLKEDSPKPDKLTGKEGTFWLVEFLDDRRLFLTHTDMEGHGLNENQKLCEFDLVERELNVISDSWKDSFSNRILTDVRMGKGQNSKAVDEKFYFLSTQEGVSYLASSDLDGEKKYLTKDNGSVDDFDVGNNRKVFVRLSPNQPQELYSLESDGTELRLTSFNKNSLPEESIMIPESFSVTRDEAEINSWVLKPPNFDPDESYPAVLEVHGGPKAAYGDVYFHELQLLANEGYVVIFSNPRGSDGRGDEFADIRGGYGQEDYHDLMAVVDRALEEFSAIDEERLGVTGGSYGGFMTNWIIGHTNRFKAAVSCRSISNWVSKFNTTDIGYFFVEDQQDGNPWEDHDKLWDQSPLKYADQVETPTLFIHSREDYRCWEGEALQMFTALKYFDVPAKLCLFEGENHELSRSGKPENRVRRLKEMLGWFDKYLK